MDLLGNRLIEAYRRINDAEIFPDPDANSEKAEREIASVRQEMVNHRRECFLCRTLQSRQEAIRAFAVDEPVWRGMMAS